MKKMIISIIVVLIVLWGIIFFIDYSRCSNFKEPIFVVAGVTTDDGGSGTYYGLGYKVKMEKTISAEYGITLVKVEMYMFDNFITGAIADTKNIDTGTFFMSNIFRNNLCIINWIFRNNIRAQIK